MRIDALGPGDWDRVRSAEHLFDGPVRLDATSDFLGRDGHHVLIAYVDGVAAGFVTGVEMVHPDKGTEMFVYELGVDEPHRRAGVGRALIEALHEVARGRRCYGMWALTEAANDGAIATYRATGAAEEANEVMFIWPITTRSGPEREPGP